MKHLFFVFLLGTVLSLDADATDLNIRLTGKWLKFGQEFAASNTSSGEYAEAKRDAKIHYELRSEGFLALFDQDKEFTDNKVLGVDIEEGISVGSLIERSGKYYWRLVREWKDEEGNELKTDETWEAVFKRGDWQSYQKGLDVELRLTREGQQAWDKFHTGLVVKFANDLRESYVEQYPKVTIKPVVVEKISHKDPVVLSGNIKAMKIKGSDSTLVAKVVVVL